MKQNQTTSSHSNDVLCKRIDLMFSRFAAFYGHVWRSQFKSEGFLEFAKKEWSAGLASFSDEAINEAILNCRDHCEMPPTLPQVIAYCKQVKKRQAFYVADKKEVVLSAVAARHIQRCKTHLITQ